MRLGVRLVWASNAVIAATAWLLAPTERLAAVYLVIAFAVGCGVACSRVPERLQRGRALLLPALTLLLEVTALGGLTRGVGPSYLPLITIAFIYTGLSCPPRTSWLLLAAAVLAWAVGNDMNEGGLTAAALIRLPISAAVWMLVGELLAYSTSQLRARTELLADQVATDALTGLGSRRSLPDLLAAARPGDGLVMLDLDHFHDVNASRGHAGGDRVLADFGAAVRASLRGQDRAVRYGGEEVLLLLPGVGGTSPTVSTANLDGALTRLRETWSRLQPEVTFSGGGVILQPGQSATSTVQAADRLLFAAKQAGRDCWRLAAGQSAQVATVPAARSENPASLTERRS